MNTPRGFGSNSKSCALFTALFLFLVSAGCERHGKVELRMLGEIHHSCTGANLCSIRVKDFTAFDWDRAFFFSDAASEQDRSKALGTREEGYSEFEDQLAFLKNGRIVYQESEPTNVEKPMKDGIAFAGLEDKNFTSFAANAAFAVSIEDGPAGKWFLLKEAP